jgi:hypothetical protein
MTKDTTTMPIQLRTGVEGVASAIHHQNTANLNLGHLLPV